MCARPAERGAGFELVIRPAFDTAKNAVLDQLNIPHDAVQPPTVGSLITNAAMAIVSAHDDPRLDGYSARQIASIATRAKIRSDAGIPLGSEDGPAVAALFNRRGINVDPNDPMTRPLSGDEQAVNDGLQKQAQKAPETEHHSVSEGDSQPTSQNAAQSASTLGSDVNKVPEGAPEAAPSKTPEPALTQGSDAGVGTNPPKPETTEPSQSLHTQTDSGEADDGKSQTTAPAPPQPTPDRPVTEAPTQPTIDTPQEENGNPASPVFKNPKGSSNQNTNAAAGRGSTLHSDKPGKLPDPLRMRYPNTELTFTKPGKKGQDVTVGGGVHPSDYPTSEWPSGVDHGDFKPDTPGGRKTFKNDQAKNWPQKTHMLPYDPTTGKLK